MISDKEMQKRVLYKIKTCDGKVKKVRWEELPSWRKDQIFEGEEALNCFMIVFPILVVVTTFISVYIHIFK